MVKISQGHIKSWLAGTPPLSEQRAIASFLDRETAKIDGLVAKKERLIELLQEKRTALITRAVTQGLDPNVPMKDSGVKLFRKIPREWATARLRWLMQRVVRPVDVDPGSYYREIGIRSWGRGAFHKEQRLGAHLEDKKVFYVCPGDFVLNIVFAWEGAVAVMSEGESGMIASHRFPTFRHAADNVDLDYLLLFFQSDQGRDLMALHSPGAAGRNKTIRLGAFLDEEIPLPPLVTQRRIVSRVREQEDRMYQLLGKAGELMEYLKEFRTALICAAVTGKIDVRDESA
jgi:type I restriction enzyme S subunit